MVVKVAVFHFPNIQLEVLEVHECFNEADREQVEEVDPLELGQTVPSHPGRDYVQDYEHCNYSGEYAKAIVEW